MKESNPQKCAALTHRCRAIQQLSAGLKSSNETVGQSQYHWAIASCIALRIQSGFLENGMLDSLIFLRLTSALEKLYFPTYIRSTSLEGAQQASDHRQGPKLSVLRTFDSRIVQAGSRSLASVVVPSSNLLLRQFHIELSQCFYLFQTGTEAALDGFGKFYRSILTMPEVAFLGIFDSKDAVAHCLVAHYFALVLLVNAFVIGMSPNGHHTAMGKGADWIALLCRDYNTSDPNHASFRWPLNLTRTIELIDKERTGPSDPMTSSQLLEKIFQQPELFAT